MGSPGRLPREGEEPLDGLRRELREEAGVEIEPLEFAGAWADRYGGADDAGATLNLYWHARIVSATPLGRRLRVPLVRNRRPSACRRHCFPGTSCRHALPAMKRLMAVAVVLLALVGERVARCCWESPATRCASTQAGQKSAIKHVFLGWQQGMTWGRSSVPPRRAACRSRAEAAEQEALSLLPQASRVDAVATGSRPSARSRAPFGCAPVTATAGSPSRKRIIVGIDMTPYCGQILLLVDVELHDLQVALIAAICSSTGATAWHGPHHSAQKSTRTGVSLCRASLSKVSLVTGSMSSLSRSRYRTTSEPKRPHGRSPSRRRLDLCEACSRHFRVSPITPSWAGGALRALGGRADLRAAA